MIKSRDGQSLTPLTPVAFAILSALAEMPMYAYALVEQCRSDDADSFANLRAGNIYTTVRYLKSAGLIVDGATENGAGSMHQRQYFEITTLGRAMLQLEAKRHAAIGALALKRLSEPN